MSRGICVRIYHDEVTMWQRGLQILSWRIARTMQKDGIAVWPELRRVDREGSAYKLTFAWPNR